MVGLLAGLSGGNCAGLAAGELLHAGEGGCGAERLEGSRGFGEERRGISGSVLVCQPLGEVGLGDSVPVGVVELAEALDRGAQGGLDVGALAFAALINPRPRASCAPR